ncbi:MAG: class I SAM-dependent methyltransferase [Acidimicrobiales bacterium]
MTDHDEWMRRVYSEETWSLYNMLEESLDPRAPDVLHQIAADLLSPGDTVLDAGCRDAAHLIRLVQANDISGVGVDPVPIHIERARLAVAAAGLEARIQLVEGIVDDAPLRDGYFDFTWCRDVLEQVGDLPAAVAGMARLLKRGGSMLVFTNVVTDLLEPGELTMLGHHKGNVMSNLFEENLVAAFDDSGFRIVNRDSVGTEWREYAEERTQPVSKNLLELARLRRRARDIRAIWGHDVYAHVEANLHWELFQFLGKLEPVIFVLERD